MDYVDRSRLLTRVIRLSPGDPWPEDDASADDLTMEERIELVWTLTQQAYAIAGEPIGESRLQRHVVHVERRGG
jgi:hypothetical protein